MNDGSDHTQESIVDWATNYASYEDLEVTAKALYGIYAQVRKNDHPEDHKTNKMAKNLLRGKSKKHRKAHSNHPRLV